MTTATMTKAKTNRPRVTARTINEVGMFFGVSARIAPRLLSPAFPLPLPGCRNNPVASPLVGGAPSLLVTHEG